MTHRTHWKSVGAALLIIVATCGCGTEPQRDSPPETFTPPIESSADSVTDETETQPASAPNAGDTLQMPDQNEETDAEASQPPAAKQVPVAAATGGGSDETAEATDMPIEDAESPVVSEPANAASDTNSTLDQLTAAFEIPPPWLEDVTTTYDTSQPWSEARLEIRRLLGLGKPESHREALKLMWIYHVKDDMNDHHEYPMYTFLGGEPVWSVLAHREYLSKPHEHSPIHAYITLAALYMQYGEFEQAEATLDQAMQGLPEPPWRIMRKADLMAAYGKLYEQWGKLDDAKRCYAEAKTLYPTARPPYGGHLLPRRAADAQAKFDLLTFQALASTELKDGQYHDKALGYAGDIDLTVRIEAGKIVDIQVKHKEKIDQNACVIVPERIMDQQSLMIDGVSGATVTKDAIVTGVYRCLQKAGLK